MCVFVRERERENSLSFKMRSLFADLLSFPLTKEKTLTSFSKTRRVSGRPVVEIAHMELAR